MSQTTRHICLRVGAFGLTFGVASVRVAKYFQQPSDFQPKEVIGVENNPSHPSLDDISLVLAHLVERVATDRQRVLDPIILLSLHRVVVELKRHVPGYYLPKDVGAAAALATGAADAIRQGKMRAALGRSLGGLSYSPHNPELWYFAGSACLQLGSVETAVRIWQHCLWIHPFFEPAQRDLAALAVHPKGDAKPYFQEELFNEDFADQLDPRYPDLEDDRDDPRHAFDEDREEES